MPSRTAQAEAAMPQCELRACLSMYRQLRPLIGKQEGGKASEDCTVVACRIAVCAIKREGAEGVLGTRRCATGEQQPCNLGVMECREVVEEALLARQDCTQVSFDELRSAKRNAKGNNTALCQRGFLGHQPKSGSRGQGQAHQVGECQRSSKPWS